ncbi:MAG: hypothetical protein HKL95_09015 [Phycisphaerae bacterium]|nr:hypothetical protein [Phycisphaerae bacterium]
MRVMWFALRVWILVAAVVLWRTSAFGADATVPRPSVPQLGLPLMKAPTMAGAFKPAEWAGADEMTGFNFNAPGGPLVPWTAHYWVGASRKDLFIAVVTQTPPGGKLLARVNPKPFGMNSHLTMVDDTVELVVAPALHTKNNVAYQMVVNAKGAVWQQKFESRGTAIHAWHGHWKVVSKVVGNRWNLQVAIPWMDLGVRHIVGKTVGIRIGRDWLQIPGGGWVQSQWSPLGGGYLDTATLARVTWLAKAPVVQVRQLQNRPDNPVQIRVSVENPGQQPLVLTAHLRTVPRFDPPVQKSTRFTLAPGGSILLEQQAHAKANEPLDTAIDITSRDGKTVYYRRTFTWKISRPRRLWSLNRGASKRIDTAFMYYPSLNSMQVKVNLADLANRSKVTAVQLEVRKEGSEGIVASTLMPALRGGVTSLHEWKLPPLNGKYDLLVELRGVRASPQVLPFVRYHFNWEHNQLGRDKNLIVPPFKAIKVHGKTVDVVLREVTMNGLGLWGQVVASGRKLLSGSMAIVVRAGGKRYVGHGTMHFMTITPTQVVAMSDWQAGPLKGHSRSVWDYDGMMKTTLTLQPTTATLDSVALVIPMVNKEMPLMTACTDGVRFNYSGKVPSGVGVIWNSSDAPHNSIIGSFVPYIWMGGVPRGIATFGDNDAGWVDYQSKLPCQQIVRRSDGTLELRLNLVAKPARLKTSHQIVLGFQATPIKPMPANWRLWTENVSVPGAIKTAFAGTGLCWGTWTGCGDIYPRGHDFEIFKQFQEARHTGRMSERFLKRWLAGYKPETADSNPGYASSWGPSVRWFYNEMTGHPREVVVYTDPSAVRVDTRAGQTYLNEWDRHVYPSRRYYPHEYIDGSVYEGHSYRDYVLWYYRKLLSTFDDGIYWDDMFLQADFNTVVTNAYRLPDGYVQPSTTLWVQRALVRRTAVLAAQLHKPDMNMVHMTDCAVAPELSFAHIDLDLEDKFGENPFQQRFSRAFLLAESTGRQFGNIPCVLAGLQGNNPAKLAWAGRTEAGVVLTMELRGWDGSAAVYWRDYAKLVRFGYGTPATTTWDYWRRGYPMKISGDKTSSIIVAKRQGGQVIVVVCDWGHGGTIQMRLNQAALHLKGGLSATDMETGKPLSVTASGRIVFHLRKFDFKMVRVTER